MCWFNDLAKVILRFVQLKIPVKEKRDDDRNNDLILQLNHIQPSKKRV
jgi:hypothetical protein